MNGTGRIKMARIALTEAVKIINGVKERFGVEVKTHSTCGLKGFYLTVEEPSQEVTDYIVEEFRARGGALLVEPDQKTFVYNVYDEYKQGAGAEKDNA